MSSAAWIWQMVRRLARAARRRLLLLTASVVAGVAALVAVNSFTENLTTAVGQQAQELLGADLSLTGREPASQDTTAARLVDSLQRAGGPAVRTAVSASFAAMAFRAGSGGARLVQVRTVDPGWPYYGTITTSPAGVWRRLQQGAVIVDPSLLTTIGAHIGDTLALGDGRFPIAGTVVNVPGDIGLEIAFGARVFIATSGLPATHLLSFGSRADYQTYLQLPPTINAQRVARANDRAMRAAHFSVHTIADDRDNLTRGLIRLGNYLGLVALAALLLGGLGVASAVHVFIRQQLDTVAVLRCLGATSWQLFAIYLVLAFGMGLLGSLIGAVLGVVLQQLMPYVVRDFLPVGVHVVPSLHAIIIGVACGLWAAVAFALMPLLSVRAIPPLATIRRNVEPLRARWDGWRVAVAVLLPASVVALAAIQVGSLRRGAWFIAGCAATLAMLWIASRALVAITRRWTPARWAYLPRQGLANLHRPGNQTVTVVLALGFGAFILTTLFTVQQNLLQAVQVDTGGTRANLVFFDIQSSQRSTVDSILRADSLTHGTYTPIVPMRIRAVNATPVAALVARDSTPAAARRGNPRGASPWAARREFRSTYRSTLQPDERLVAGRWFSRSASGDGRTSATAVDVSLDADLSSELGVRVGDSITWDVQGVPVYSRVTSLRDVNWARFEPNFFVVFAPGALERAPQSWVVMVDAPNPEVRGRVQREVAERAANVTGIDLGEVQHAIESVVDRIVLAIRFMALFSLATGTVVLIGAIATSRWQRVREGTLLRTLGATRRQVLVILCVEYAALGLAAAVVAATLAGAAGWALAHWVFSTTFVLPVVSMALLAAGLVALTTAVGLWNSGAVLHQPPLQVLRTE